MQLKSARRQQRLDDIDIRTLLQLGEDLSDQPLDGFLAFIRRHYALAEIAYYCPSFRGRSLADPYIVLAPAQPDAEAARALYRDVFEPAFAFGSRSVHPVDWARFGLADKKSGRRAGGRRQGLPIPVRGPANSVWALFAVTSDETDVAWAERHHDLVKDLVHIAFYVHQRAYDLHDKDAPIELDAITRREIEALEWSAEGKNLAEIAILMRISLQTVKAHLDSARFKLHALNRVHAVTKAIRAGLIR